MVIYNIMLSQLKLAANRQVSIYISIFLYTRNVLTVAVVKQANYHLETWPTFQTAICQHCDTCRDHTIHRFHLLTNT